MISTLNTSVNPGVAPPSATGGDINLRGGGTRLRVINNGELSSDSPGGTSYWGGPERSVVNATGLGGQNYGVGGNGANVHKFAGTFPGGAGHDGVVVVEEFY